MHTLFIDTHLWDIIIYLLKDGQVISQEIIKNKKNNSEYIFPSIVKVIDDIKLNEIIVVNGPGSFTGVRLGVTIAKTLAYTLNIPIKTINALECMAVSKEGYKVAFGDSNGFYVGNFTKNYNPISDYTYLTNDEFAKLNMNNEYITEYNIDASKIYKFLLDKSSINPHLVKPIYVKKIGVELDKSSK